jgi:glycosyltransferase involved in cell wall biosynthesis
MRIAFLCKRRYMGKDVIEDRYARLYEIPFQLASRGHDVLGICLSYYADANVDVRHPAGAGRLRWISRSLGATKIGGILDYPRWSLGHLRDFAPDVLIAASDIPHVIAGEWLARRLSIPFAADLYDNFESFGLARIPGFVPMYRRAVRRASLVTCTSEALADYVRVEYGAAGTILAMPSTIDHAVFYPRDRRACREKFGLPLDAKLVGTAGGLYEDKGVGTLYEAYLRIADAHPDLHLVLAGPFVASFPPPSHPRVHHLGSIAHDRVAELFCALDVGVIYLRDTPFGRYCFPQKAYEMLASGLPVVAADVGAMRGLLANAENSLYRPDDVPQLAERIEAHLKGRAMPAIRIGDWAEVVGDLDAHLRQLVAR